MIDLVDSGDGAHDETTPAWTATRVLAEAESISHIGSWVLDVQEGRAWWSDETYRIFGHDPQTFAPSFEKFMEQVHPEDLDAMAEQVRVLFDSQTEYDFQHRVLRPDGQVRHVREHGRVVRDAERKPLRVIGTVWDVTHEAEMQQQRDEAVRALADSEQRHRLLAENAWDVVWTMAVDGSITYVSPSVERVRGLTPAEAAAQSLDEIHPPESASRVTQYFSDLYAAIAAGTELPRFNGEQEYYRKDGSIMLAELQVIPHVDQDGRVIEILGVTRDISERREFEEQLSKLAVTDPLTGVWNRRRGEELFAADLADALRYDVPMSLLFVDIDDFKAINDDHGHQVGDRVLIEICERLRRNLRATDTIVRWGGDEFIIMMRNCTQVESVSLADDIRALISAATFVDDVRATVSIGVAQLLPGEELDSWLDRADRAAYAAKASGRDCVRGAE